MLGAPSKHFLNFEFTKNPKSYVMSKSLHHNVVFGCIIAFFCLSLSAQSTKSFSNTSGSFEANKRASNYQELRDLGYSDQEIFEDLGNANFLSKNYQTAIYWYEKLSDLNKEGSLTPSYHERYQYALQKSYATASVHDGDNKDWLAVIKADYQVKEKSLEHAVATSRENKYRELDFNSNNRSYSLDELAQNDIPEAHNMDFLGDEILDYQNAYKTTVTITADGKTAYFNKATYVKPLYGIFSKKQLVHKIFKADKIDGEWQNIQEVAVCPKYASAVHPTVSEDGKRLFFASNMPGTYGDYDIYVSVLQNNGNFGMAKNLGKRVNTKKNDLYPSMVGDNTLFFASDGREGHGGLDVFMVQVDQNSVGWSVNLGSPINSAEDDFSIFLTEKGRGYVMSNRGKSKVGIHQVAFNYVNTALDAPMDKMDTQFLDVFSHDPKTDYTSSVYEDE